MNDFWTCAALCSIYASVILLALAISNLLNEWVGHIFDDKKEGRR